MILLNGDACAWCVDMEGTYEGDDWDNISEYLARHSNCNCTILSYRQEQDSKGRWRTDGKSRREWNPMGREQDAWVEKTLHSYAESNISKVIEVIEATGDFDGGWFGANLTG